MISIFYLLCSIGNAFVGYFRGSGRVNIPFIGTTLHTTIRVILSYLLVHRLGMEAVALATGIGWVVVVAFQSIVYWRIRRMEKQFEPDLG